MNSLRSSFLDSLTLQIRTMSALAIRFIVTRYGRENIGFLWVIIEPMLLCVGVMLVWSVLKGGYEHGVKVVAVVFTGYMPLTLQRHMSGAGIYILRSSKSTLIHRNISYFDNLLVRMFLEFVATSAGAAVIYTILVLVHLVEPAYDFGYILLGWAMMGVIAFGIGCLYAGISEKYEFLEKFIPAFNYLLVPFSGCFFMVEWLPYEARELILYVPLIHAFEVIRAGMFGPSVVAHYYLLYAFACAFLMTAAGFIMISSVRDRVR